MAGGNGWGHELNQLARSLCLYVDDDQTVFVSDHFNHRVVEWNSGAASGRVVVGGHGQGTGKDQLDGPLKVIVDQQTDSLIICDYYNRRLVRWPRQKGTSGEIVISNVACSSVAMDNEGSIYVSDYEKHEVKRWKIGETNGTVVAGGNGVGDRLDQLNYPRYIVVDQTHSVYVSDYGNHRVVKWMKDAKEGTVVAGGQGPGNGLGQLSAPHGIAVDHLGIVYIADYGNHRIVRWLKGASEGSVVVGRSSQGDETDQLDSPCDLSFDRESNLYVLDYDKQRVQKFYVERNSNS